MNKRICVVCIAMAICTGIPMQSSATVIATGQRTIFQPLEGYTASDLHFTAYQADRETAWIESYTIDLNVPYTTTSITPSSWPFSDGHTHSITADLSGMSVAYESSVDIEVSFDLNEYNSVKFANMYWTYPDHDPVPIIGADIGWGFNTTPGTSSGGWVIAKYTIRDLSGNIIGIDLVGHQNSTGDNPSLDSMFISNGTPDNPGSTTVRITDWGVAQVDTLPTWDEIDTWSDWDIFVDSIDLDPGGTTNIPEPSAMSLAAGMTALIPALYIARRRKRAA